jgi:hypothetical protein
MRYRRENEEYRSNSKKGTTTVQNGDDKSRKNRTSNNKASWTYHLREFCRCGNNEPNDTLKNVECSETTKSQPTRTNNAPPVSKGGA